ncbi:MAG TPA: hypothetical protein VIK78_18545 [Ruminiclostridium sp.]
MVRILVVLLTVIGAFTLICGLSLKPLKVTTGSGKRESKNGKTELGILESITSRRIIQKPLDFLSKDKELWTNKLASRILELSEVGISLQQMYLLKIICLIICTLLVLAIRYTNTNYQAKLIVESSGEKSVYIRKIHMTSQDTYCTSKS